MATIGADERRYDEMSNWERRGMTPSFSWHPHEPRLAITRPGGLWQWTPQGLGAIDGPPSAGAYRFVAFSPDGATLWASPSFIDRDRSDVVDLAAATVHHGPLWDTGVALHPGGGLVATFHSDQGETLCLFARVQAHDDPAGIRLLSHALILDADGYETPVFSPDGRYLVVRGNAYENSLHVFEFPSLRVLLETTLGEPSPGYPAPPEWQEQFESWSRHNIAFAPATGRLLVGTPDGALVEIDLTSGQAVRHDIVPGDRITALAVAATGDVVLGSGAGDLVLTREPNPPLDGVLDTSSAHERVAAFLATTTTVADDADLHDQLEITDGTRSWTNEDLAATTTATSTDPMWLRFRAHLNSLSERPSTHE